MLTPPSGFADAFKASNTVPVVLVKMDFLGGAGYYTNWPINIPALSQTWLGTGTLGGVGELKETETGAEDKVSISLSIANTAMIASALSDPVNYQNREVLVYVLPLDTVTFQPLSDPMLRFSGVMDIARIERQAGSGTVYMDCRTGSYAVRNNPNGLRLNDVQHQQLYPGELGFQYVQGLIEVPTVWLSVRFQAAQL